MRMLQRQNTKRVIAKQMRVSVRGAERTQSVQDRQGEQVTQSVSSVSNGEDNMGVNVVGVGDSNDVKIDIPIEGGTGLGSMQKKEDGDTNIDGFGNSSLSAASVQSSEHLQGGE